MEKNMDHCVYKITNPSGKMYIGVTNNFKRRMYEHKSDAINYEYNWALHNSIRKYGFESHICEIMHNQLVKSDAYQMEKDLIIEYDLLNSKIGLNSRGGGLGDNTFDWKSVEGKIIREKIVKKQKDNYLTKVDSSYKIIDKLIMTKTINEIANELKIGKTTVMNYLKFTNQKCPVKKRLDHDLLLEKYLYLKNQGYTQRQIIEMSDLTNGTIYRIRQSLKEIDTNIL